MDQEVISCCSGTPNWVEVATLVSIIVGGLFAWWQWRRSLAISKVEMLRSLVEKYESEEVRQFFYECIDSEGSLWWDEHCQRKDAEDVKFEREVDGFLSLFDNLCYLYFTGLIDEVEFNSFGYQVQRLLKNEQTSKYLEWLHTWCQKESLVFPFWNLVMYGAYKGFSKEPYVRYCYVWRSGWRSGFLYWVRRLFCKINRKGDACRVAEHGNGTAKKAKGRISDLVRGRFCNRVIAMATEDERRLQKFCNAQWSKKTFKLQYPVLKEERLCDGALHRRYYAQTHMIGEKMYRLCNHWYEGQRELIEKWLSKTEREDQDEKC